MKFNMNFNMKPETKNHIAVFLIDLLLFVMMYITVLVVAVIILPTSWFAAALFIGGFYCRTLHSELMIPVKETFGVDYED